MQGGGLSRHASDGRQPSLQRALQLLVLGHREPNASRGTAHSDNSLALASHARGSAALRSLAIPTKFPNFEARKAANMYRMRVVLLKPLLLKPHDREDAKVPGAERPKVLVSSASLRAARERLTIAM